MALTESVLAPMLAWKVRGVLPCWKVGLEVLVAVALKISVLPTDPVCEDGVIVIPSGMLIGVTVTVPG